MRKEPTNPLEWAEFYYKEARDRCLIAAKSKSPRNRYDRELAAVDCLIRKKDLQRERFEK